MNGLLANIGTFALLLMYTALIAGATFPGVLGGMVVQKIFYTVAGTAVYLYLFLSVPVVLAPARLVRVTSRAGRDPHRRRRFPPRAARARLLEQAARPLGEGQAGRRDPRNAEGVLRARVPAVVRGRGSQSWA